MSTTAPDIFSNVHKGIRRALFEVCIALGRAGDDTPRGVEARARLSEALRFVAHHGENEELLLLPLLERRAAQAFTRMRSAHVDIDAALRTLSAAADVVPAPDLYERACGFTTLYLEHMREEERELEPEIRAALSPEQLAEFGRRSVERTAPDDRRMMLAWMLPAMTRADVEAFLARLPAVEAEPLRALVRS